MSFLDKIKSMGKGRDANALDSDNLAIPLDDVIALDRPMMDRMASPPPADAPARTVQMDSSIITEAAPSELPTFPKPGFHPQGLMTLRARPACR